MQKRVKRTWTNAISMVLQLVHHGQPKDWLVSSVQQHMNPYKAEEEFPLLL